MNIYREIPESTKPEKAWMEHDVLCVDFHLWNKDMFYYVDAHYDIPVTQIIRYTMFFGKLKGFKKIELYFNHPIKKELILLKLSNTHEQLAVSIYNLLKAKGIKPKKQIITGEGVRN